MNLDIQLAWCRHLIRERLGLSSQDAIILFICDARSKATNWNRRRREAIQAVAMEMRWQFSHPLCVLLSLVENKPTQAQRHESSLIGILDKQMTVNDVSDLCGWVGAANTLFFLPSETGSAGGCSDQTAYGGVDSQENIETSLARVAVGFRKPWNVIPQDAGPEYSSELDWERLHQGCDLRPTSAKTVNSLNFMTATEILEKAWIKTGAAQPENRANPSPSYRRVG
ncbi:MAG: hypothetical protein ACKOAU_01145 [Pirellula sp.]|jgi:hypothetical protein